MFPGVGRDKTKGLFMSTRMILPSLAALAVTAAFALPASAAEPSGTALAVIQSTSVAGQGGTQTLKVSAPVYSGDRVITGGSGQAQLQFVDQTKLVVGPNSSLVIDAFVFNPNKTAKSVAIGATRGTFRFITGLSPKSAYSIKTPTATIGVRGTQFDVSIVNGITNFALYEGGARICSITGQCIELQGECRVAVIPAQNVIQRLSTSTATAQYMARTFPYAWTQSRLLPQFRVDSSACGNFGAPQSPGGNPTGFVPAPAPSNGGDGGEGGDGGGL
jgi:ferric-dicitrate binding protein FerR (iron transport regulator)